MTLHRLHQKINKFLLFCLSFLIIVLAASCSKNYNQTQVTATPIAGKQENKLTQISKTKSFEESKTAESLGSTPTEIFSTSVPTPHISPYVEVFVTDIEIKENENKREEIILIIKGTLPDQCDYGYYTLENREGNTIKIDFYGIHPAQDNCSQNTQIIEYELVLGKDLPENERTLNPGEFNLIINNFNKNFTVSNNGIEP